MDGISVILPCKGYEPHLTDLLSSLADQDVNLEVLVVDDGRVPSGNVVAALDWWKPRRSLHHIEYGYTYQLTGGYGAALALGTEKARGDLLLYADADVTFPPGLVAEMVELHNVVDIVAVRRRHGMPGISMLGDPWIPRTGYVTTWACLLGRDTLQRLGGWRDVFLPDADLWLRARAAHLLFGTASRRVRTHRKVHQETRKLLALAKMVVSNGRKVPNGPYTRPLA